MNMLLVAALLASTSLFTSETALIGEQYPVDQELHIYSAQAQQLYKWLLKECDGQITKRDLYGQSQQLAERLQLKKWTYYQLIKELSRCREKAKAQQRTSTATSSLATRQSSITVETATRATDRITIVLQTSFPTAIPLATKIPQHVTNETTANTVTKVPITITTKAMQRATDKTPVDVTTETAENGKTEDRNNTAETTSTTADANTVTSMTQTTAPKMKKTTAESVTAKSTPTTTPTTTTRTTKVATTTSTTTAAPVVTEEPQPIECQIAVNLTQSWRLEHRGQGLKGGGPGATDGYACDFYQTPQWFRFAGAAGKKNMFS